MKQSKKQIYDLIVLGGGCAGLTAGIYAGRAKLNTIILEQQQIGGQAAITAEVANYPGIESVAGPELMDRMLEQAKRFGTELVLRQVTEMRLAGGWKELETDGGVYQGRSVILASGASPKQLGFAGETEFRGKGVSYCATCDGFFFREKDIFVIGGGNSAAEEALFLTRFGKTVTMIVRKDRLRCEAYLQERVLSHPKIQVRYHTELVRAYGDTVLRGAEFRNNETGEQTEYRAADGETFGIFVFVGYEPNTGLFAAQVRTDDLGYVTTDEKMRTSLPGVFAAGDLRAKPLRQLVTAAADGAVAAMEAERYIAKQKEM